MADKGLAHLDLASGIVLHCACGGVYDQAGVNAALGNRLGPARQAGPQNCHAGTLIFTGTCNADPVGVFARCPRQMRWDISHEAGPSPGLSANKHVRAGPDTDQ